ncbi:UPF0725 protein At1g19565 [Eutrema salsugineum]|uniref:UPF0725 protein At1g19565 n=1 Tax=Eutrema salsugineum TaxID=72664 RepID=UPI000CED17EB|nr:UPF0725 protein At1g19565 [Eutrema salsugineum]
MHKTCRGCIEIALFQTKSTTTEEEEEEGECEEYREGFPDVNFVPPEEELESETSLPSSESEICHDDLEPPSHSPKYEPSPPGEMPVCYLYEYIYIYICSDPQKVDWADPIATEFLGHVGLGCYYMQKPKMKAKAENANFYITFSTRHGFPFHTVTRRTTTGKPNQMSLEFKMLMC